MARKSQRNNILAGSFLIGAVVLAVALSVVLSDVSFSRSASYTIRFPISQGATGLRAGSDVFLGGQPIGKVSRISFFEGESSRTEAIDVRIRVRAGLVFHDDAVAFLDVPLLGSLSSINFQSLGGEDGAAPIDKGGIISGRLAPPAFLAQAGYGTEEQTRVRHIIETIDTVVSDLAALVDRSDPLIVGSLDDARAAVQELRAAAEEVSQSLPDWTSQVDRSLGDVNTFTEHLPVYAREIDGGIADARAGIDETREVIRTLREATDEARPRLDAILADVQSAAAKVDDESIPRLNQALETIDQEMASAGDVVREFGDFAREQFPALRFALANVRLASEQFKLVMTEVRQQPWRLLIRPTTKELKEQLVYDAARAYAEAVSNLRAASEAMEASLAGGPPAAERATLEDLRARLDEAFTKYQEAEKEMLSRFLESRP